MPNWVYFNVVDIDGGDPLLKSLTGDTLKRIGDGPFNVSKTSSYKTKYPQTIIDAPTDKRDWVWQTALDSEERPVVLFVRLDDARTAHNYYYARWTGTEWRETEIGYAGHAFHKNWSVKERCYSSGMTLDPDSINTVYVSLPTKDGEVNANGVYELWKYVIDDEGNITQKTQLTTGSKKNNVRPYVLPGSTGTPLRLAWMNGDYYFWASTSTYPQAYPTAVWADCELPVQDIDLYNALTTTPLPQASPFTISLQTTLQRSKAAYQGTFFSAAGLSLSVTDGYRLDLTVGDSTYRSPSRFLYTDAVVRSVSAAAGETSPFTYMPKATMTLTYDGHRLTLYRNGLIDIQTDIEGLAIDNVQAGTYQNGLLRTWSRALNSDEVRQLTTTKFDELSTGIRVAKADAVVGNGVYSLSGQRIDASWLNARNSHPGLYIVNGKKLIVK